MQGPCRGLRTGHRPLWHILALETRAPLPSCPASAVGWTELAMPPNPPPGGEQSFQTSAAPPLPAPTPGAGGVLGASLGLPGAFRPCHLGPGSPCLLGQARGVPLLRADLGPGPQTTARTRMDGARVLPPRGSLGQPACAGARGLRGAGVVLSSDAGVGAHSPAPGHLQLCFCSPGPRLAFAAVGVVAVRARVPTPPPPGHMLRQGGLALRRGHAPATT